LLTGFREPFAVIAGPLRVDENGSNDQYNC
jgi:hypothetical protein